jgi:hypothetical protein
MYLDINVKRTKYNKGSGVKTHADVAGLHLSTPSSRKGSATVSVTSSGPQVTASNRNFSATVNKQVKSLAANSGKARVSINTNRNISAGYGPVNVSHSPHGTGVSYKNISAHKPKSGGYSATAHKNINGMNASFTAGKNPQQGKHVQVNLNIPTGRRNK